MIGLWRLIALSLSFSSSTTKVVPGTLRPGSPWVYGTARVGSILRSSPGSWRPSPVTFRYRWKIGRAWVTGTAGTRSYLKIPRTARGKRITLVVTASKPGYTSVTRSADPTAVVR